MIYGVYIVVLCFDLRISEFVLRKASPCCKCLGKGSGERTETQPLMGWNDDTSLRVHIRPRTDSGIFQDDSGYSHLSLSLHGLNEIPEGKGLSLPALTSMTFNDAPTHNPFVCWSPRTQKCICCAGERPETDLLGSVSTGHCSAFPDYT